MRRGWTSGGWSPEGGGAHMLHNDLVKVPGAPNAYPAALCEGEHAGDFRCAPRRESVLTHSVCDSPCALNVPASASACPSSSLMTPAPGWRSIVAYAHSTPYVCVCVCVCVFLCARTACHVVQYVQVCVCVCVCVCVYRVRNVCVQGCMFPGVAAHRLRCAPVIRRRACMQPARARLHSAARACAYTHITALGRPRAPMPGTRSWCS